MKELYLQRRKKLVKSAKEIIEFEAALKAYGKEIAASKEKSNQLLVRIGVITKKGNIRKPYKNLCTPQGQD